MARYDRQIRFAGIGHQGQAKLQKARVVLIGLGAIGSVFAERMTRAGVGFLRLIDRDFVEPENLHSQALYDEEDAQQCLPKAIAAERKLRALNSEVTIEALVGDLTSENAEELLSDADLIADGTDNFETRFLINDVCVKSRTPWIYSSAVESYGATMTIRPGETPCLRCLYPELPPPGTLPTCETSGLLSSIPSTIASIASAEALKLLVEGGTPNPGLLYINLWEGQWKTFSVKRRTDCPTCALGRFEYLNAQREARAAVLCGRDAVQIRPVKAPDLAALASRLRSVGDVRLNAYLLQFRDRGIEIVLFADGRAIIKGASDLSTARRVFAKYIGL